MTLTLPYRPYSPSEVQEEASHESNLGAGSKRVVAPSPFEIPESVVVRIERPNCVNFMFMYASLEESDSHKLLVGERGDISYAFTGKSRRIAVIRLSRAKEFLRGSRQLELDELAKETATLPAAIRKAAQMNHHVIQHLLTDIPDELLTAIHKQLA